MSWAPIDSENLVELRINAGEISLTLGQIDSTLREIEKRLAEQNIIFANLLSMHVGLPPRTRKQVLVGAAEEVAARGEDGD